MEKRELDTYLFHQGRYYQSYDFMGAHEVELGGKRGVLFNVWAPNASAVSLVGDFNQWNGTHYSMKRYEGSDIWNLFVEGIANGERYKYEIDTQYGERLLKSDPYAFYAEERPKTASIVYSGSTYKWKDQVWMEKRKAKNHYREPMNIYELHLGSWRHKATERYYTYREIADMLIPYVIEMGYTHIEIMPIGEHPYDGSWGYQATGYFAVTSRYGSPDDFKYLIDTCHHHDISVILDWVPCHFCKDAHGLRLFDGQPAFESGYQHLAENEQWGTVNFDFSRPEVRSFLISNAHYWFDQFHIDGLRVDAVAFMLYLDYGREPGSILNAYGSNENPHAIAMLRELNASIFAKWPGALMIAEESTSWPLVTAPTDVGGLGFNFKWNMGWMNDMLEFMEMDPIYRKHHMNLLTFSLTYAFSENFVLPLSHDEVVHGKRSLLDKMPGDYWQKFANLRLLYGYMVAHPGKKLLFMGGEFGHFIEWNHKRQLDWFLLEYEKHHGIHQYMAALNQLYQNEPAFYELDDTYEGFEWIDFHNPEQTIVSFYRKTVDGSGDIVVIVNFTPVPQEHYRIGVNEPGSYMEVFNSDHEKYGGSGVINTGRIITETTPWHMRSQSVVLRIPPLGVVYLKGEKKANTGVNKNERNEKRNRSNDPSRGAGLTLA